VKLLPALALAAVGIYVISKLAAFGVASRLNLFISSYSMSLNGITPVVTLGVTAQNVTSEALQFGALAGNAYLNGTLIGNVSGFTPVNIAAQSQTVIPLTIVINATAVISDVVSLLNGTAGTSVALEVKGTANVSNLVLPVDITYNVL
jgi:hypothetical protein